ncbi:NUDIX hydrolase [Streptomyces sp. NBC_01381]|uniref:NUDIX hydrolase n=1 Tax=Streptomyces sp. NBC_01381 TaxID=2903845 RepID=UPI00224DF9E8|nr:NUDIX hydrolase [Streptomyces sp. NBC_01381]MCX4666492.1 NUDIX hydrolase [Streptomyces sp. NBC_01381]
MRIPVDAALLDQLTRSAEADNICKHVVAAVITNKDNEILLLHRRFDDYLGGLWELPSSAVGAGESLTVALHRGVEEETGLVVTTVDDYLGHFDYLSKSGKQTRQFNFSVTTSGRRIMLTEHDAHEWATHEDHSKASASVSAILDIARGGSA